MVFAKLAAKDAPAFETAASATTALCETGRTNYCARNARLKNALSPEYCCGESCCVRLLPHGYQHMSISGNEISVLQLRCLNFFFGDRFFWLSALISTLNFIVPRSRKSLTDSENQ